MKIPENGCFDSDGECGEFQFLDENPVSVFDIPDVAALNIHPNPTTGELTIDLPDLLSGQLLVRDLTGQIILTQVIDFGEKLSLDLSDYDAGIYLVEVVSESGDRYVQRVVLY